MLRKHRGNNLATPTINTMPERSINLALTGHAKPLGKMSLVVELLRQTRQQVQQAAAPAMVEAAALVEGVGRMMAVAR